MFLPVLPVLELLSSSRNSRLKLFLSCNPLDAKKKHKHANQNMRFVLPCFCAMEWLVVSLRLGDTMAVVVSRDYLEAEVPLCILPPRTTIGSTVRFAVSRAEPGQAVSAIALLSARTHRLNY